MASITCSFEKITPDLAHQMLSRNEGNRRLRVWWVEAMASAMSRGEWLTTHQGVAFTAAGRLVDGQHRLAAVVKSGVSIEILVVRGLDETAFHVIDNGIKRTMADLTGLPSKTAEVCRLGAYFVAQFVSAPSTEQVLEIAECGVAEVHNRLLLACGSAKAFYSSAPIRLAATLLVMDGVQEDTVFQAYANLVHQRFDLMPPIAHSFVRQVSSGKLKAIQTAETLARGLKVLNPSKSHIEKLTIDKDGLPEAREFARKILRRAMGR